MTLDDAPDVLKPEEVARLLRIGKNAVYDLLKSGAIYSVRHGKNYLIPKRAVLEYLGLIEDPLALDPAPDSQRDLRLIS